MNIHPAARAFDTAASDYERGRPTYPPEAIAWLAAALRLGPGATVVDLAGGTGKLTRQLVPTGAKVVAVEPVPGMRDALKEAVPEAVVIDGTAEAMPLPDTSVDAMTAGQAFHWFDGTKALAEIHRVLRPGGRLGIVWNGFDLSQPVQRALDQVVERHRKGGPHYRTGAWRTAFRETAKFSELVEGHFTMEQVLDAEGLLARILSISVIADLTDRDRQEVVESVGEIIELYGEPVTLQYVTDCYWCERL